MSDFLLNLARRGAGLPAGQINVRPSAREYQASSEILEQAQTDETGGSAAFEPDNQPASETTPALRTQTLLMSQAQAPHGPHAPLVAMTPARASLIQRTEEANNQTADPLAVAVSDSRAPSAVDQNNVTEVSITSPPVVREFHPAINERPSSTSATAQPTEQVAAIPRATENKQPPKLDLPGRREPSRNILSDAPQIVPLTETHEDAPQGERQRERERDQLNSVTLTPRLPFVENQRLTRLSNVAPTVSADPASIPIHVRIGKVEIPAAPPAAPPSAGPVGPAPIGFGSYYRLRTYRN